MEGRNPTTKKEKREDHEDFPDDSQTVENPTVPVFPAESDDDNQELEQRQPRHSDPIQQQSGSDEPSSTPVLSHLLARPPAQTSEPSNDLFWQPMSVETLRRSRMERSGSQEPQAASSSSATPEISKRPVRSPPIGDIPQRQHSPLADVTEPIKRPRMDRSESQQGARQGSSSETPELSKLLGHTSTPELVKILSRPVVVIPRPVRATSVLNSRMHTEAISVMSEQAHLQARPPVEHQEASGQASSMRIRQIDPRLIRVIVDRPSPSTSVNNEDDSQEVPVRATSEPPLETDQHPTTSESTSLDDEVVIARITASPRFISLGFDKKVELRMPSVMRLRPNVFMDDCLINFGFIHVAQNYLVAENANDLYIVSSFFYDSLLRTPQEGFSENVDEYTEQKKAIVRRSCRYMKRIDVFAKKFIIVPVCQGSHWILTVIVNPAGCFEPAEREPRNEDCLIFISDSLGRRSPVEPEDVRRNLSTFLEMYSEMVQAPGGRREGEGRSFVETRVRLSFPFNAPTQENDFDCGLYTIYFFEHLFTRRKELLTVQKFENLDWEVDCPNASAIRAEHVRDRIILAVKDLATTVGKQHIARLEAYQNPIDSSSRPSAQ